MNQYDVLSKIGHYAKVIDYIYRNPNSQATLDELTMIPGYSEQGIRNIAEWSKIIEIWQDTVSLVPPLQEYINFIYGDPEYLQIEDINKALNIIQEQKRHYKVEQDNISDKSRYRYLNTINNQINRIINYIEGSFRYISEVKVREYSEATSYKLKATIYEEVTNDGSKGENIGNISLLRFCLDKVQEEIICDVFYKQVYFPKFEESIARLKEQYHVTMRGIADLHSQFTKLFNRTRQQQLLTEKYDKLYSLLLSGELEKNTDILQLLEEEGMNCMSDDLGNKPRSRRFIWISAELLEEDPEYMEAAVEVAASNPEKVTRKAKFSDTSSGDYAGVMKIHQELFASCVVLIRQEFEYTDKDLFTFISEYDFKESIEDLSEEEQQLLDESMRLKIFVHLFNKFFEEYYREGFQLVEITENENYRYPKLFNRKSWNKNKSIIQ